MLYVLKETTGADDGMNRYRLRNVCAFFFLSLPLKGCRVWHGLDMLFVSAASFVLFLHHLCCISLLPHVLHRVLSVLCISDGLK